RNVVRSRQLIEVPVVGYDRLDIDGNQTRAPAQQQVMQAMAELGHHQYRRYPCRRGCQAPFHVERVGDFLEVMLQTFFTRFLVFYLEGNSHEETGALVVIE